MSVVRSVSTSKLSTGSIDPSLPITQNGLHKECIDEKIAETSGILQQMKGCNILLSKAQTLDRFSRLASFSQHGEKRKKSIFASFRLSKKSFSKEKEEKESSGSDLSQTSSPMKIKDNYHWFSSENSESLTHSDSSGERILHPPAEEEEELKDHGLGLSKPRRHYLNRVSFFVNKFASRVSQSGDPNLGYNVKKSKLERSHTFSNSGSTPIKVDYFAFEDKQTPAAMGIRNHGNTCFINAVIQCLSHTDYLAEYFVLDQYKVDLARSNRITSKKFGTKGEITEHLATLLKSLWVHRYAPDISLNLKNIIEKFETGYRGSNQHDSAEFLMFILDKVHEDLNTASKRKYKKIKNSYGRPDEIVAAETLANHLRCNSSFIQDLFQAQFRSSLKCPHCLKESNTFDPYLCVSIPIPQKEIIPIYVSVVYLNQQPKQVKIGVAVESSNTVKDLRNILATDCGICPEHLLLTEVDGEGFHRTFSDSTSINIIQSTDPIYAIELTPPSSSSNSDYNSSFLHVVWMNVLKTDSSNIRFGGVYQSHITRDVSYTDLQKLLLKEMTTIVTNETLLTEQNNGTFQIGVNNGTTNVILLDPELDLPLLHQSVEEALSICNSQAGPVHVKLVLHWNTEDKEKYIIDDVDHVDEHSSVDELKKKPNEYAPVTLGECLQLHTSAELLSCGDAWHCPTCNRKQQVLKRLNLWSAPQVLVVHLKRFKQVSHANSSKLSNVVNFPLTGFDITEHMAGRFCSNPSNQTMNQGGGDNVTPSKMLNGVWSPWKRHKKQTMSESDFVYDLYAVVNHHGQDLQSGHYTATCRNPSNGRWFSFDDFTVSEIAQADVSTKDAYILFYQKRDEVNFSDPDWSHWSSRIPLSTLPSCLKATPEISTKIEDNNDKDKPKDIDAKDCDSLPIENSLQTLGTENEETCSSKVPLNDHDFTEVIVSENAKSYLAIDRSRNDIDKLDTESVCDNVKSDCPTDNSVITEDEPRSEACSNGHEDSEDVVPDIRIKPASLEELASHKHHKYHSSAYGGGKVVFRSKTSSNYGSSCLFSRPNSVESDVSAVSCNSAVGSEMVTINGGRESSEEVDEETPSVIINSTPSLTSNSLLKPPPPPQYCRKSNSHKTASFVVIRTPSPNHRPPHHRDRSSAPSLSSTAPNSSSTYGNRHQSKNCAHPGRAIINNHYSSTNGGVNGKRPCSYSGVCNPVSTPAESTNSVYREKFVQRTRFPAKDCEKTRSSSCVMECQAKHRSGGFEKFLTESSV